jgi:NTP pyrophosphatase (non-canonical NTP hydrolase)
MTTPLDKAYADFVALRFKKDLGGWVQGLLHAAVGISGEAGELLDAIKKTWVYEKPLDIANVIEELGDLEFYMEAMRAQLGVTRVQVIEANVAKLTKRYPTGYSDEAAQARADKES